MSIFTDTSWIGLAIGVGGYIVAGILVVMGMLGMGARDRRKDDDSVASNLINNLKLTVEQQDKTMVATNLKLDETTRQLHLLQGRNTVLEQLFNGSEGSILAFLKQAPELQRIADENNKLAKATSEEVRSLTSSIERLVVALTPKTPATTVVTTTTS